MVTDRKDLGFDGQASKPRQYDSIGDIAVALKELSIDIGDPSDWLRSYVADCHSYLKTEYMSEPHRQTIKIEIDCLLNQTKLRPQGSYNFKRQRQDISELVFMPKVHGDNITYAVYHPKWQLSLGFNDDGSLLGNVIVFIEGLTRGPNGGQIEVKPEDLISARRGQNRKIFEFLEGQFGQGVLAQLVHSGIDVTQSYQQMIGVHENPCSLVLKPAI